MAAVAIVNFRGVGESVKINVLLTLVELSGLLIIIVIGFVAIAAGKGDVSRVTLSHMPRLGTVGYNGETNVAEGFVLMRRGENPSVVLGGVHEKVNELNDGILPKGMRIAPFDALRSYGYRRAWVVLGVNWLVSSEELAALESITAAYDSRLVWRDGDDHGYTVLYLVDLDGKTI